jgi:hypothetical protein
MLAVTDVLWVMIVRLSVTTKVPLMGEVFQPWLMTATLFAVIAYRLSA